MKPFLGHGLPRIIIGWQHEVGLQLRGILQIEVADAVDAAPREEIGGTHLQGALESAQPHEDEGGQHNHAEHEEGCAQVGKLCHQGEGD